MSLPDRSTCFLLMKKFGMPPNIQRHSLLVARVAVGLVKELRAHGMMLDLGLTESAALLHDVGKSRAIQTREDHAVLGAKMLEGLGLHALADIVIAHTRLKGYRPGGHLSESLVVNYADKRVKHDELVDLTDRFHDLARRYARSRRDEKLLEEMLRQYLLLEREIFSRIDASPEALLELLASDLSTPLEVDEP